MTEKLIDDIDILQIQCKRVFEDGTIRISAQKFLDGIHSGKEITEQGGLVSPAQLSVLRSEFLEENEFKFFPGIYHEDAELKSKMVYTAKKIAFHKPPVYYYLKRTSGSIMTVPRLKRSSDMLIVCRHLHDFQMSCVKGKKAKQHFDYKISNHLNHALHNICKCSVAEMERFNIEMWQNRDLFIHLKDAKLMKYRLEYHLFRLFPKKTIEMYRLLQMFNHQKDNYL